MRTLVHAHQRRAVRRAVRIACHVVRERDCSLVARQAIDLSPQGMLVRAEARVLSGEPVFVAFRVTIGKTIHTFDVHATVARVVHGRRSGDAGYCLGLEFEGLDGEAERLLRAALCGVPPPLPMREPRIDYAASVHLAALS
ncbi:MAG: PilZ domain-containing protein [Polyangiaceae bacterium]|nr:PilZ domain-containing protein [Polyangiaceae bacterium]